MKFVYQWIDWFPCARLCWSKEAFKVLFTNSSVGKYFSTLRAKFLSLELGLIQFPFLFIHSSCSYFFSSYLIRKFFKNRNKSHKCFPCLKRPLITCFLLPFICVWSFSSWQTKNTPTYTFHAEMLWLKTTTSFRLNLINWAIGWSQIRMEFSQEKAYIATCMSFSFCELANIFSKINFQSINWWWTYRVHWAWKKDEKDSFSPCSSNCIYFRLSLWRWSLVETRDTNGPPPFGNWVFLHEFVWPMFNLFSWPGGSHFHHPDSRIGDATDMSAESSFHTFSVYMSVCVWVISLHSAFWSRISRRSATYSAHPFSCSHSSLSLSLVSRLLMRWMLQFPDMQSTCCSSSALTASVFIRTLRVRLCEST